MENQLIVYVPKKNVKKIVLLVILGLIVSLLIFITTVFFSTLISLKNKNKKIDNSDYMTTIFEYKNQ